jgi:hypothetical protein
VGVSRSPRPLVDGIAFCWLPPRVGKRKYESLRPVFALDSLAMESPESRISCLAKEFQIATRGRGMRGVRGAQTPIDPARLRKGRAGSPLGVTRLVKS